MIIATQPTPLPQKYDRQNIVIIKDLLKNKICLFLFIKKGTPNFLLASLLLLFQIKLSESHNPLVGLSRPLPSSWPGGRVSARNPPAISLRGSLLNRKLNLAESNFNKQVRFILDRSN
jgi:hypothetical protein